MKTIGFPWSYGASKIPKAPNLGISPWFSHHRSASKNPSHSTGPAMGSAVLRPQHLRNRVWLVNHTDLGQLTGNSWGIPFAFHGGFPLLFKVDSHFQGGIPDNHRQFGGPPSGKLLQYSSPCFFSGSIYNGCSTWVPDQRNAQYRWFKLAILPSVICYNDHILDCLHLRSFRTELGMLDCHSGPSQSEGTKQVKSHKKTKQLWME